jgi:hypothetical protein
MDKVYAFWWVTLLIQNLRDCEVDGLELVDDGVVELFRSAKEESDFLEYFAVGLGNDLIS